MITKATDKGNRPYQEDRSFVCKVPEGTLLGVFDGHGGDEVATLLAEQFPKYWHALDGDIYEWMLIDVFEMASAATAMYLAGSTASLVFIPTNEKTAYVAVLGDSPVIAEIADGSLIIGPDHNARSNQEERSMAIARGGVYLNGYMWSGYGDYASGLQMTRALGDSNCSNFLSRVPEVFTVSLGDWLLVGSDGMFDPKHMDGMASYDDVLACIRNGNTADQMVQQAIALPTNDNVTVILWRRA